MLLFTMMTEELNWELPPEPRGILEHRTWRLRFLGPASFLCILQNETKSREPAHTTDKLLRLSEKGNTCPSRLSAREVYARSSLDRFLVSNFCDLQITLIITIWNMSLAKVDLVESLLPHERLTMCR